MANGLTIGQAAAFVGVTIKTVRHYHRLDLVAEPERDGSGYRRYGSPDLLRLIQVRTLAGAGVPLAEIGDLLDADPERFAPPPWTTSIVASQKRSRTSPHAATRCTGSTTATGPFCPTVPARSWTGSPISASVPTTWPFNARVWCWPGH